MFENLQLLEPDPILGLIGAYNADPRKEKVDLGAGVYRTEQGHTPVLATVKAAEKVLLETQSSKTYTGSGGADDFNALMQNLLLGDAQAERSWTIQTPGGSGALRVAAWLLLRARGDARVWVSDPTWANHVPLLGSTGLTLETYPYYDKDTHEIRYDAMLECLRGIPQGDVVLLHASCHNPTGAELSAQQWAGVADVMEQRSLVPFFDMAYLGFAGSLEQDVVNVRQFAGRFPEMLLASSCSKNFGLYRDRVGALTVLTKNATIAKATWSQAVNIVRRIYSVPPNHGAAIVATILADDALRAGWTAELKEMRERLMGNRSALVAALHSALPERDFSHVERGRGMFSLLGLSKQQVHTLRDDFAVYMVDSSRINVAGVSRANLSHLAGAIGQVCR